MSTVETAETPATPTATKVMSNEVSMVKRQSESTKRGYNSIEGRDFLAKNLPISEVDNGQTAMPGKAVVFYIMHPKELRDSHPVWHVLYLMVLISAAFCAIFVGPVVFGMLATFCGIGAPVVLSMVGSVVGLFVGVALGVVFAVLCIVALVRVVGWTAEWILDTLWSGGADLFEYSKTQINYVINSEQY